MGEAAALGGPQEVLPVVEEVEVVVDVDPALVRLGQDPAQRTRAGLADEEVEAALVATHRLHGEPAAVRQPLDAGDVLVGVRHLDPGGRAAPSPSTGTTPTRTIGFALPAFG